MLFCEVSLQGPMSNLLLITLIAFIRYDSKLIEIVSIACIYILIAHTAVIFSFHSFSTLKIAPPLQMFSSLLFQTTNVLNSLERVSLEIAPLTEPLFVCNS